MKMKSTRNSQLSLILLIAICSLAAAGCRSSRPDAQRADQVQRWTTSLLGALQSGDRRLLEVANWTEGSVEARRIAENPQENTQSGLYAKLIGGGYAVTDIWTMNRFRESYIVMTRPIPEAEDSATSPPYAFVIISNEAEWLVEKSAFIPISESEGTSNREFRHERVEAFMTERSPG